MPIISIIPLAITAGIMAIVLLWSRVRSGPPGARLAAKVGITTLMLFALALGRMAVAQRWPW